MKNIIVSLCVLVLVVVTATSVHAQNPLNLQRVGGTTTATGVGPADAGTLRVAISSDSVVLAAVSGGLSNNAAAPGSAHVPVLSAIANATQPTWTEGREVLISVDLTGAVRGKVYDGNGNDRAACVDASKNLCVAGPLITYNATQPTLSDLGLSDFQLTGRSALIVSEGVESPCKNPANTRSNFNVRSAGTTPVALVAAVSAKTGYICEMSIHSASAEIISILDGTQSTNPCDASTPTAVMGNTTAASGVSFPAGGGVEKSNGGYWIFKTTGTNRQLCGATSGSGVTYYIGSSVVQ